MHTHTSSKNSGFALVIALSLMAFVLLLLLSITTLVQVETRVSKGSTANDLAQQNALLALNIALGQLQKDTGPDQRTTATAALNEGTGAAVNQPNWVGVYGNASGANYSDSPDKVDPSAPVLLNWLVSGNEGNIYAVSDSNSDFGRITQEPAQFEHEPTNAVTSLSNATTDSQLTVGTSDAALLVGPNSTSQNSSTENYVVAPLVDIETNNATTGRYAWWIGDEGTKAKVNLRPSYLDQNTADQEKFQNFSFLAAQRSALEVVDYDDSGSTLSNEFDFTDPNLAKVNDLATLTFLGAGAANSNLASAASERFHDLTAVGHGVLADAYAGGLKKDLTADFGGSTQRPADDLPIFTPLQTTDSVPTWGNARSLINNSITYNADGIPETDPILPSATNNGIYPTSTVSSLGFDYYISGPFMPDPLDPTAPPPYFEFKVAIIPAIVLWNPHAVTIKAADYELGLRIDSDSGESAVWVDFGTSEADEADVLDLYTGTWQSDLVMGSNFLRFRLKGEDIPPGESQLYSLETNGDAYVPGTNIMKISDESVDNILNHVTTTSANLRINAIEVPQRDGSIKYELPGNLDIRVASNSTRNAGDEQRFDIVLADTGGLSTLSSTDDWYQAILDARIYHRGDQRSDSRASGGTQVNIWLDPADYSNDLENLLMGPDDVTGENISVYRMVMPMERRGGFVTKGYFVGSLSAGHRNNAGRTRWLITGNPRASVIRNTEVENDVTVSGNSLFGAIHLSKGSSYAGDDFFFPFTTSTNGSRLSAGRGQGSNGLSSFGVAALFDQLDTTEQFLSPGQLQHSLYGTYGFYPSYPFGNSWADVRIDRDQHYIANRFKLPYETGVSQTLYDISWHMNRAIWDRYFVSSVPDSLTNAEISENLPLPNSRMDYYKSPDVDSIQGNDAYDDAAANLWIDGAFNINSTSEQAWRSLLSATFGIPDDNGSFADDNDNVSTIAPIPRFSRNQSQIGYNGADFTTSMKGQTGTGGTNYNYIGNRGLSMDFNGESNGTVEELVNELARTIVGEVKARGPFLSLGDFVNRSIIADTETNAEIGIKGALQAGIDKMSADDIDGPRVNSWQWQANHGVGLDGDDAYQMVNDEWHVEHYLGGPDMGIDNQADMPYSVSATGSPKSMSQADLLSVIGSAISARSDTFRIRTYGETINPVTKETEGRAWCEAIVQRLPEYVDTTDTPEIEPVSLSSNVNTHFGRKYKILSLRWLPSSEI